MSFPAYTKIAIVDGIRVPVTSFNATWGEGGKIQFAVGLLPSYEAERILPSTAIHIFHVETSKLSIARRTVEVDGSKVGKTPFNTTYLKTDFLRDNARKTMGSALDPHVEDIPTLDTSDDLALDAMRDHGIIYLVGGVVDYVQSGGTSSAPQQVQLQCRGHEVDAELIQLIQLVGGRGTLTDKERRFLGQDTDNEGKPKSILTGNAKGAVADALAKMLVQDKEFAAGIRNIIAQFPATVNTMWLHRFAWNRLAAQIAIVEKDSSIKRLISSDSFKPYLKDMMQRMYIMPLWQTVEILLDFVGYKVFSIPAPAFWPIVPRPEESFTESEDVVVIKHPPGRSVLIQWPERYTYDSSDLPPGGTARVSFVHGQWYYGNNEEDTVELPTTRYVAGQLYGRISEDGNTLSFKLPLADKAGNPYLGGGNTYVATCSPHPIPASFLTPGAIVSEWEGWGRTGWTSQRSPAGSATGDGTFWIHTLLPPAFASVRPSHRLQFQATVIKGGAYTSKKKTKKRTRVPPQRPVRYYSSELCRLNTYVVLPKLWWACPPLCNVIVPEMLVSCTMKMPGLDNVTRLLGKIPPGNPGDGKVFVDKFSAPDTDDLNRAMEDVRDDPVDSKHLQRTEYLGGIRAGVDGFGHLTKLVTQSDWEPYISSKLEQDFWDRRFEGRQASVVVKTAVGFVPGTTALVIRGTADTESNVSQLTPEQQAMLAKLRKLRALRNRLSRAKSGLQAHQGRVALMRRWISSLRKLSSALYDDKIVDRLDQGYAAQNNLWTRTGAKGGTVSAVNVGAATAAVRGYSNNKPDSSSASMYGSVADPSSLNADPAEEKDIGQAADPGSLSDPKYIDTFKRLLGPKGADIHPSSSVTNDDVGSQIARLPRTEELDEMSDNLNRNGGNLGGCIQAIIADIKIIDDAIKDLMEQLRSSEAHQQQARSFIGYVRSIQEGSSAESASGQTWTIQLTHVRHVGEDLDWDGIAGDDVENTIIFGPKGYLDDKYSTEKITEEVYIPMFGSSALADAPGAKEAFEEYVAAPLDLESADIAGLLAKMRHPTVCGKSYATDEDKGLLPAKPDTTFAAMYIINAYTKMKAAGAVAEDILGWVENLHVRPWMTFPDAYRGFPLAWDRSRETAQRYPIADYSPWESDEDVYGFSSADFVQTSLASATQTAEGLEPFRGNPADGFWRAAHMPPHVTAAGSSPSGEVAATADAAVRDYLSYGGKLDNDELAMLKARQGRVIAYLESLENRTTRRS